MCFSAGASFGAGAVLAVAGSLCINKTKSREVLPFAFIPLFFAVQQVLEGFIWLSRDYQVFAANLFLFKYFYLVFAQILWPIWVPFSLWKMETDPVRRKWLFGIFLSGTLVSTFFVINIFQNGAVVEISEKHVFYNVNANEIMLSVANSFYFVATVVSFFVSKQRVWLIGFLILIALIFTRIIFPEFVIYVWCFFAAIISLIIYFFIRK